VTIAPALATILPLIATGLQIGGSLISAGAQFQAAKDAEAAAKENAKRMEENAQRALDRAQDEIRDQDMQTAEILGQQIAVQSASGLRLDGRSFILTRRAARELGRRDAAHVREAAELEAFAYRTQSAGALDQARTARNTATSSLLAGFVNVGTSLVSGAQNYIKPQVNRGQITSPII
jgi:hypothetical protein